MDVQRLKKSWQRCSKYCIYAILFAEQIVRKELHKHDTAECKYQRVFDIWFCRCLFSSEVAFTLVKIISLFWSLFSLISASLWPRVWISFHSSIAQMFSREHCVQSWPLTLYLLLVLRIAPMWISKQQPVMLSLSVPFDSHLGFAWNKIKLKKWCKVYLHTQLYSTKQYHTETLNGSYVFNLIIYHHIQKS